jgi:branched-chain amino acid aminotransferase
MIPIASEQDWKERLFALQGGHAAGILAFYDHRLGVIVRDPRCAMVPLDDHLVHRGDGIFEYIRFSERRIVNLDAHLARLTQSAAGLELTPPCSSGDVRAIVLEVARASGRDEGALRILMGRGQGGFGIEPAECPEASLYVAAHTVRPVPESLFAQGASACRSRVPVRPAMLARLKTTNYLPNVLMTLEASRRGVDFSFSFDDDGFLAEAAMANVALVDAGGMLVMPEFRNALQGTTARKAAELAEGFMPVEWRGVPEADLFAARDVLLLGTAHECLGIVRYEDRVIGEGVPGPVARRLRSLLHSALRNEGVAF